MEIVVILGFMFGVCILSGINFYRIDKQIAKLTELIEISNVNCIKLTGIVMAQHSTIAQLEDEVDQLRAYINEDTNEKINEQE